MLFASNTEKQKKLGCQLASVIPLVGTLVDKSTWIRDVTNDGFYSVGGKNWDNSFEQKIYSDQTHFKKFSPELFSTLVVWQVCQDGYYRFESDKHSEYSHEIKRLTENFLFYDMPGMTPFPFQDDLRLVLRYRENELPKKYKPYVLKQED